MTTSLSDRANHASALLSFWLKQVLAIMRLETKKSFVGRRLIAVYFLAFAPVAVLVIRVFAPLDPQELGTPGEAGMIYAIMFQTFVLRFSIFFGCMAIFTGLFRREVMERTLHFYLLSPVKREVLVVGKYASGLIASITFFVGSTVASLLLVYLPYGGKYMEDFFVQGAGMEHLVTYACVAAMACIGYGAVFLLVGLYFRNPIFPAGLLLGWETINFDVDEANQHDLKIIVPLILGRKQRFIEQLAGEIRSRHRAIEQGTIDALDVKENRGGLRDIELLLQILMAASDLSHPVTPELYGLLAERYPGWAPKLERLFEALRYLKRRRDIYRLTVAAEDARPLYLRDHVALTLDERRALKTVGGAQAEHS